MSIGVFSPFAAVEWSGVLAPPAYFCWSLAIAQIIRAFLPEPINAARSGVKESFAFGGGIVPRYSLKRVPNRNIGTGSFVHGKVAFKHTALNAKFFDAKLEIRPNCRRELGRCGLLRSLVPIIPGAGRTYAAQFHHYV